MTTITPLPSAAPETVGLSSERLGRINDWMHRYIDAGKLSGMSVAVMRDGHVAFRESLGLRDRDANMPMQQDTIVRIYSMSKPITTVAAMMLYEHGLFQLDDPITRFLPQFKDMQVWTGGEGANMTTRPAERTFTVRDLMTHTSGLTYGFMEMTPVDALYRENKVTFEQGQRTLAELVDDLAQLPLLAEPGTEWNYSVSTDVLGHLVEVISGQDLQSFFAERIFAPLGMSDTSFHVPADKLDRFAACYVPTAEGPIKQEDSSGSDSRFARPAVAYSGGGGLVSTQDDYLRFCQMMLNGGELGGARLLGRKTVELMRMNHLPGDMASMGQASFSETSYEGHGFGLGFSVVLDPAQANLLTSAGEHAWGGMASTGFWLDPAERLAVVLLTQLIPSSFDPLRRELRVLTYQAIID